MSRLDSSSLDEIVRLLEPELRDERSRRNWIDTVFVGASSRPDIDLAGPSLEATRRIVLSLLDYGDIEPDKPALWAFCAALLPQVGVDRQARLEALREVIIADSADEAALSEELPPAQSHVFLSYARSNRAFVDALSVDLLAQDIQTWIDRSALKPGTRNWETALREAIRNAYAVLLIASPEARQSNYVLAELAIAEMYNCPVIPVWAAGDHWIDTVPMEFVKTQYFDLRPASYSGNLPELVQRLHELQTQDTAAEPDKTSPFQNINPYKGLRPFTASDTRFFFGREKLIDELATSLQTVRFLAVIGASGSGKSSVVMAGVLPRLRDLPATQGWVYLDPLVPGNRPVESLANLLADPLAVSAHTVREDLNNPDGRGLLLLVERIARHQNSERVVLIIDQFEEVFTLTESEDERRQWIDLLVNATTDPRSVLTVILTMRADFYDRPMQYPALAKLVESQSRSVLPMDAGDLRAAIEKPAALVGLGFEDGLVGDVLFEVRGQAGSLPLLQFTLDQLYRLCVEQRGEQRLTIAAYREIGGVLGALAQHAEATYNTLPDDAHRQMARALFLRLIEPGVSDKETTRRRARRAEFMLAEDSQTAILIATESAFTDARLLVTDGEGEAATVEVSHEALIREWGRLRTWLAEGREDVLLQNAIEQDASDWQREGKRPDDLYRGARLLDAQAWAKRSFPSADEQAFLDASAAEEIRREAAAQAVARRVENFRRASILLAVFVFLALGATVIVGLSANNAVHESEQAGTNVAIASTDRASADTFRQQVEYDATVFAVNQARAQVMLGRFGIVPDETETLASEAILARATSEANPTPHPVETQRVAGTVMVRVPPGCFLMGSVIDSAAPVHQVCFETPYWIDRLEVSRAQYNLCVAAGTCSEAAVNVYSSADDQPVNNISWTQALAYCRWRGARLPTEPEWEYAARGPSSLVYPWGDQFEPDYLVYIGNSQFRTAPVGSRPPASASWVGALDMSGNVWEWVSTAFASPDFRTIFAYPYDPADGREDLTNTNVSHVTRGGSFNDDQVNTRGAHRGWQLPGEASESYQLIGVRCAASETEAPGAEG